MSETHTASLEGARILVTGADGFIGANLTRTLLAQGLAVDAMVSRPDSLKRLSRLSADNQLTLRAWNLADNPGGLVARHGYDVVFHLGAIMPGQAEAGESARVLAVNCAATLELAKALADRDGFMVFAGTVSEYSGQPGVVADDAPAAPDTLYGLSKAAAVLALKSLIPGKAWCVTRLFGVYGPWEAPQRLLPYIARQLLRGEPALLSHGKQIRDFIFVADAAQAMIAAACHPAARGRVYNIGSGQGRSVREVALLAGRYLGRPELLRFGAIPGNTAAPDNFVADTRRATQELGFSAQVHLPEGVAQTVQWIKDTPDV